MTDNYKTLFILQADNFQAYDVEGEMIKVDGNKDIFYSQLADFWLKWEDKLAYIHDSQVAVDFCILAKGISSTSISNKYPLTESTNWTIAEVVNILQKQVIVLENNVIAITEQEFEINIELLNDGQDTTKLIEQQAEQQLSKNALQRYWQAVTESYIVE